MIPEFIYLTGHDHAEDVSPHVCIHTLLPGKFQYLCTDAANRWSWWPVTSCNKVAEYNADIDIAGFLARICESSPPIDEGDDRSPLHLLQVQFVKNSSCNTADL